MTLLNTTVLARASFRKESSFAFSVQVETWKETDGLKKKDR